MSSFGEAQLRGSPPALRHRDFRRLWGGLLASGFASQMVAVAVGWQVYAIHQSAFDLGLIGLAEFIPLPLLALPAGQMADRMPRVRLFAVSILAEAVDRRTAAARDDRRRARALAVPDARGPRRCDPGVRTARRALADAGDRPDRSARRRTRSPFGRRPTRNRRRPCPGRAPLRNPARDALHRGRGDSRRLGRAGYSPSPSPSRPPLPTSLRPGSRACSEASG